MAYDIFERMVNKNFHITVLPLHCSKTISCNKEIQINFACVKHRIYDAISFIYFAPQKNTKI